MVLDVAPTHGAERHPTLWFEDGNVVLKAERTLFKVHRSILCRESKYFKDMRGLNPGPATVQRDGTIERPLVITNVSGRTFGNLLGMVCSTWGPEERDALSAQNYVSVLRAAHRYQFPKIKELACAALEDCEIPSLERLIFGLECEIAEWLFPSFVAVVYTTADVYAQAEELTRLSQLPADAQSKILAARIAIVRRRRALLKTRRTPGVGRPQNDAVCAVHLLDMLDEAIICAEPAVSRERLAQTVGSMKKCLHCSIPGNTFFKKVFSLQDELVLLRGIWDRAV